MELLNYMPLYFRKSKIGYAILAAIEKEFERLEQYQKHLEKEMLITTSVDYLTEREKVLGLSTPVYNPEKSMSDYTVEELSAFTVIELSSFTVIGTSSNAYIEWLEYRRSRIWARIRGYGTVNENLIKRISESYTDGEVDIVCDYSNYNVTINFISKFGKPAAINEIIKTIKTILPAHLKLKYKYKYRTWQEVFNNSKSWADLLPYTWQEVLEKEDILYG